MEQYNANKSAPNGLLLSILLHVLLLLLLVLRPLLFLVPDNNKKPFLYTPSYVYHGAMAPAKSVPVPTSSRVLNENTAPVKDRPVLAKKNTLPLAKPSPKYKSMLTATDAFFKQTQREMLASVKYDDPVYLIGDKTKSPDPLVRLLAYALSAHFSYPDEAGQFGIKGRVLIGMTLHPDGRLSDIEILQSSGQTSLDRAALYAVNKAPSVKKARQFISTPKHFVIGFIFRLYAE